MITLHGLDALPVTRQKTSSVFLTGDKTQWTNELSDYRANRNGETE